MSLLESIDSNLLLKWINAEVSLVRSEQLDRAAQEKIIKAIFGNSLLKNKSRLTDFLLGCDQENFGKLCSNLKVSTSGRKKLDIALDVAAKPFTEKSVLASQLKELFSIEDFFMPIREKFYDVEGIVEPVSSVPPAFDYQLELIKKVKSFLNSEATASLMQLPTGSGKTRVAIQSICEHLWDQECTKDSFIWLAHTQELCEQAYDTFLRIWSATGNRPVKTYCLWGGRKAIITANQAIAIFSTFGTFSGLYERNELVSIIPRLHCVFVDEAHRASSRIFGSIVRELKQEVKVLGLTATPGRHADAVSDNLELKQLFESHLITSSILGDDPIKTLQERNILGIPRIKFITGSEIEVFEGNSGDVSSASLRMLAHHEERNQVIVKELYNLISSGHKCLVFSCSVEHSKLIVAALAAINISSAYVDSDMSSGRRASVINMFARGEHMVLVNYGILSTGFDVPDISAVVITRPTSSIVLYSQMLGRGMRGTAAGGSDHFIVLDIRDNNDNFGEVNEVYNHFESLWLSH